MNTTRRDGWDALSLREKSEMMKVAVQNGIYNLDDIRKAYNEFAEGGPKGKWTMQDEAGYKEWRDSLPDNLKNTDDSDYDIRGAYKAGMQPTLEDDGYYHLGSRDPRTGRILKSPWHPTYPVAIWSDAAMGYYPTYRNGETYTEQLPWGNRYAEGGDTNDEYFAGTLPEVTVTAPRINRYVAEPSSTYTAPYISELPDIRFVGSVHRDTLTDRGGKPSDDMSYQDRWERQKRERTAQDWRNLYDGLQRTVGTSVAGASLFTGGPWALNRLLNGNKASTAGQFFSKYLLATSVLDNYNDAVDLVVNPSVSGVVDLATGLALSRYKDFGSRARQVGELVGQGFNAYNVADNYKALGGSLVERANRFAMGGPYKPDTYYGRPLEKGLEVVSPEFDVLMMGKTAANAAREAAGELINNGIQGTARQRAAITSRRFGRRMKESSQDFKDWSDILTNDVKTGNYADVPLDLRALAENVWETSRYIKNTPERYIENTLPRFYRGIFRRTYNNHMKPVVPVLFSDPEE